MNGDIHQRERGVMGSNGKFGAHVDVYINKNQSI